jgi:hypothetical protein
MPWGHGGDFPLLAPSTFGEALIAQQRITLTAPPPSKLGRFALNFVVSVDATNLVLVGFDPTGQRLLTVNYDGKKVDLEPPGVLPEGLDPHLLVSDLEQAFWPLTRLQAALAGTSWQVEEPSPGRRQVRQGDKLHADIYYTGPAWNGHVTLVNHDAGYSIDIDSRVEG